MYFVRDCTFCVRYTGDETEWEQDELPFFTVCFDYDNEDKWSLRDLETEIRRNGPGKAYDPDALTAAEAEIERRTHHISVPSFDNLFDVVSALLYDNETWDEDDGPGMGRRPLLYPDDVPDSVESLIHTLAQIEQEKLAIEKSILATSNVKQRKYKIARLAKSELMAEKSRDMLMRSRFAEPFLRGYDPVEDLKDMAAQLFFLYAQERYAAEMAGKEPSEDFYYAACHLYDHAMFEQSSAEDEKDIPDGFTLVDGDLPF